MQDFTNTPLPPDAAIQALEISFLSLLQEVANRQLKENKPVLIYCKVETVVTNGKVKGSFTAKMAHPDNSVTTESNEFTEEDLKHNKPSNNTGYDYTQFAAIAANLKTSLNILFDITNKDKKVTVRIGG